MRPRETMFPSNTPLARSRGESLSESTGCHAELCFCRHCFACETQNMEYKFVELMSLQYTRSPEDVVQHQITYRYNAMKVRFSPSKRVDVFSSRT